jgi:hypothetical protein
VIQYGVVGVGGVVKRRLMAHSRSAATVAVVGISKLDELWPAAGDPDPVAACLVRDAGGCPPGRAGREQRSRPGSKIAEQSFIFRRGAPYLPPYGVQGRQSRSTRFDPLGVAPRQRQ